MEKMTFHFQILLINIIREDLGHAYPSFLSQRYQSPLTQGKPLLNRRLGHAMPIYAFSLWVRPFSHDLSRGMGEMSGAGYIHWRSEGRPSPIHPTHSMKTRLVKKKGFISTAFHNTFPLAGRDYFISFWPEGLDPKPPRSGWRIFI